MATTTMHKSNGRAGPHLARKRSERFRRRGRPAADSVLNVAIGLGGSGAVLNDLPAILPDSQDHILVCDTDWKIHEDCYAIPDCIHLSADGVMSGVLENRERYPLLRSGLIPETMTSFETGQGVGKVRMVAMVLLAYNLDRVTLRIRRLLTRILRKATGASARRLVIHLVFSLGGGTGSALAIPFAALVRDAARSIAPTLQVSVVGHCIGASVFLEKIMTPAERQRTLVNAAMTLRELKFAQQPENLQGFAKALDIEPLDCPLFDGIDYYDLTDSGCRAQSQEEIGARILANVAASDNQLLQALEAARGANPAMAQSGNGWDEMGTAVIEVLHTSSIQIPVDKLVKLHAANTLAEKLAAATAAPRHEQVRSANERCFPELGVEAALRQAMEQLRPDERYLLPVAIGKFSNAQTLAALEQNRQRWIRLGKPELVKKSIAVGRQLQQLAEARAVAYLEGVAKHVLHAGELTAAVRETLHRLEERRSAIQRELEMLAATDHNGRLREVSNRLEHASWRAWRQRPRQDARTVLERMLEADAREQALRVFGGYLDRQIELLNGKLRLAEQAEQGLALARKQVDAQLPELSEAIGMGKGYYEEVLTPEDLPAVTAKLRQEITSTIGTPGGLDLGGVLQACDKDGLPELLEEFAERTAQQTRDFLQQRTPDLVSFVEHFKLDFDVPGWLEHALQVALPAKLDLSAHGPGNSPLRVYVSVAPSLEKPLMATVQETGETLNVEYCPDDVRYRLTVRAMISRAPFPSIPGQVEQERAFEQFRETAPKDHVWGVPHSHNSLEPACDMWLLGSRHVARRSGSRATATAPLPR